MTTIVLAAQAAQGGNGMSMIIMIVAMFAIMIRPQQKQRKEIQKFQNSLTEGTPVVIGGGIYGTVKRIDLTTNQVEVEIAKGVVIRVDRNAVYKDAAATSTQA